MLYMTHSDNIDSEDHPSLEVYSDNNDLEDHDRQGEPESSKPGPLHLERSVLHIVRRVLLPLYATVPSPCSHH
jgi:hypothetical protein